MADRRTSQMASIRRQQKQKGRVVPSIAERLARREDLRRQKEAEFRLRAIERAKQRDQRLEGLTRPERDAQRKKEAAEREKKIQEDAEKVTNVIEAAEAIREERRRKQREIERQTQ